MRRFINWIADLIDDYLNAFVEKPLETLSKTISWVFGIVIGVMSIVAYIMFIAEGGYPKAIAAIKNSETGFFDGVGASFSKGTVHIIANNGVKTLKLDIPLVPETRINWAFVPLHIAIIYILKLCLDEEIIPRCRFPCSRGYFTKCINWQKKQ